MRLAFPLVVSALLFSLGVFGVLARRNAVLVLMSVELMLNAVNLNLVAFDAWWADALHGGQVLTLFVITIAAAEVGLGLAIVLLVFRNRGTSDLTDLGLLDERADERRPAGGRRSAGGGSMTVLSLIVALVVLVPFAAALAGLAFGRNRLLGATHRRRRHRRHACPRSRRGCRRSESRGDEVTIWGTIPTGWIPIEVATRADGLGVTVAIMVAAVALGVQIYSTAYLHGDPRTRRSPR